VTARRVYVVYCHPLPDSFTAGVLDRVLTGLSERDVRVSDLYADGFRSELSAAEHAAHLGDPVALLAARPDIARYVEHLRWCDTLVLVYPTWWSGQPAMLKGWLDRVWVKGVAWDLPTGADRIRPQLRNIRRIVAVTTHGSSKLVNVVEGEGGKRVVTRTMRSLCHPLTRTTWLALYRIDRCSPAQRQAFLDRVERRFGRM
jgi:NAD(P)H dehydrogenase (quinone)